MVPVVGPRRQLSAEALFAGVFFGFHQFYSPLTHEPCEMEQCINELSGQTPSGSVELLIGKRTITLDLNDAHEKKYLAAEEGGKQTIDGLIAEAILKPGDIIVDAGANIGYTALKYAAFDPDKVLAFEPVDYLYQRLEQIEDEVICTYKMALGDRDDQQQIRVSTGHAQGSSLSNEMVSQFPDVFDGPPCVETVEVAQLDSVFKENRLDFIKIDVEGFEEELLKGATETLERFTPRALQIELYDHQMKTVPKMLSRLFPYAYRAVIAKKTNKLVLLSISKKPDTWKYKAVMPPIYLFMTEPWESGA
jgi:FkbM family methyltransferase